MTRDFIEIDDFVILLEYANTQNVTIDTCGFNEDAIGFCFYGSGNVELNVHYGKKKKNFSNTKGLTMSFFANKNTDFEHTISPNKTLQCVVIIYNLKNLAKLPKQENEVFSQYLNQLINPKDNFVEGPSFYMPPAMQNAVDKIFTTSYKGAMQTMFLRSQVTELLSHFFAKISTDVNDINPIKKDEREKLFHAKEILSKNIDSPPSLNELSKLIGLNDYKLKKNFKQLFGFPVFKYLQNERLIKAHELLSTNNVTIQEAAWSVGYESLSSFSNAFIKKFGFRPSEIKK